MKWLLAVLVGIVVGVALSRRPETRAEFDQRWLSNWRELEMPDYV